jgi:hypothetical protein
VVNSFQKGRIPLSPLPVRERMKVRVRIQRATSARESGFCSFRRTCFCLTDVEQSKRCVRSYLLSRTRGGCVANRPKQNESCGGICGGARCAMPSFDVNFRSGLTSLTSARLNDASSSNSMAPNTSNNLETTKSEPLFSIRKATESFDSGTTKCSQTLTKSSAQSTSSSAVQGPNQHRKNPDSRAKDARCTRTLTFILSLTGRGNRKRSLTLTLSPRGARELQR